MRSSKKKRQGWSGERTVWAEKTYKKTTAFDVLGLGKRFYMTVVQGEEKMVEKRETSGLSNGDSEILNYSNLQAIFTSRNLF